MVRINKYNRNINKINLKLHRKSERLCSFIKEDGYRCNIPFIGYNVKHTYCEQHRPEREENYEPSRDALNQRNLYVKNAKSEDMRIFVAELMERDKKGLLGGSENATDVKNKKKLKKLKEEVKELKSIVSAIDKENRRLRKQSNEQVTEELKELRAEVDSYRKTSLNNSARVAGLTDLIKTITEKWGL